MLPTAVLALAASLSTSLAAGPAPGVGSTSAAAWLAGTLPGPPSSATSPAPISSPGIAKCPSTHRMPGYDENEPVVLLDGRVLRLGPDESLQDVLDEGGSLDPDDIEGLRIACWRPGEEAFTPDGIPVVRIHTKSALARARSPLEALVTAQEALLETSGGHARSLDELFTHGLPGDADVSYTASARAWNASAPADPGPFRCTVAFPTVEAGRSTPRITCETDDSKEIATLQELYDAAAVAPTPEAGAG